ncbi:ATP-dependent helicase [Butyrivibrio sp.]|uniref:ATP-dependent helicase n=1 Tax=Butyrivibrio sp. TaxID=28121 RepID=UPI0025B7A8DE|nr:UvrD-helicase domain-containing protein [Butyrivibrio sp.]
MIDLTGLNEDQRKAATQIDGPVLILAGAGSGKTRTITYRIAYMIDQGIEPSSILAITFTNKAAKEMKDRALALLAGTSSVPFLSTFHSFGYTLLQKTAPLIGYTKRIHICDADDSMKRLKKICKNHKIEKELISDISDWISKAKDQLLMPEDIPDIIPGTVEAKALDVYKEYQSQLVADGLVDFDDLIMQPVRVFQLHPEVLDYYQDIYRYIMVDEYQDTSHAQFEFIRLLADKYKNICVVGDDFQSIYAFRGADISNILNFDKLYPNALRVTIGQNYRSTHKIVDAAARLIKNNPEQLDKTLMSMQDVGEPIYIHAADTDRDEATFVQEQISALLNHGVSPKDIAVLYRKNAYSRVIEDALMSEHIPYRIYGGLSFYQRAEIKDITAYLKILANSPDRIALERILNVPKRGIGAAKIDQIAELASDNNTTELNTVMTDGSLDKIKGIVEFRQVINSLQQQLADLKLSALAREVIVQTGYLDHLKEISTKKDDDKYDDRVRNLDEFCNKMYEYETTHPDMSTPELLDLFLTDITLLTDQDTAKDLDTVSLMTMHRSKGLEFPYVFMIGCEEGCFPDDPPFMGNTFDVREDRRLCYVAMTRAKRNLYISYCNTRMVYGSFKDRQPSRYLSEIPSEFTAVI